MRLSVYTWRGIAWAIMAERSEFLPFGGDPQITDVALAAGSAETRPENLNFVPIVSSTQLGGKKVIKFSKRRGFQFAVTNATSLYTFSQAIQWTGVASTGTNPATLRGVIVYTEERAGTDLHLLQWGTAQTTLGTFATADYKCIGIQETLISNVANLTLAVRKTASPYNQKLLFFPNGGALTEVTDGDFPASTFIGNPVHMDGYCFIATTAGTIWNSDLNSLANWTATSFTSAQSVPDSLVGLARVKNLIVALGTRSIEFFQNAGNGSGSPLQRIDSAALTIGVLNQNAAMKFGDDMIFVSVSTEGVGVHLMKGTTPQKVSTEYIDSLLSKYSDVAGSAPLSSGITPGSGIEFLGVTNMHGIPFAVLGINDATWAYAPSVDSWVRIAIAASGSYQGAKYFAAGGQQFVLCCSGADGAMGFFIPDSNVTSSGLDVLGLSIAQSVAQAITPPLSWGTSKLKQYNWARLLCDKQTTATTLVLSYSDDGGQNYTTWGTFDLTAARPAIMTRGGDSARRIFQVLNASSGGCSFDGIEVGFEVLAQ